MTHAEQLVEQYFQTQLRPLYIEIASRTLAVQHVSEVLVEALNALREHNPDLVEELTKRAVSPPQPQQVIVTEVEDEADES